MKQKDLRHLLVDIIKILERLHIPYIITGGLAVLVWGRPRFTADIDIVVGLKMEKVGVLEDAFQQLGDSVFIDRESIENAILNRGEFNLIDGATGMKVDFWIMRDDEFDRSRMQRKIIKKILGEKICFTSPEDLILIKLKWYKSTSSSRHLEDIESIIKILGKELDLNYLQAWAKRFGALDILGRFMVI